MHDPAPGAREPRGELARIATAPAAQNHNAEPARMASALVAQEPRVALAFGVVGARHLTEARDELVRDWDAAPHLLRGETLLLVLEVYGWLNWATSGYKKNQTFDAMLLWRVGGNRKVPPGGQVAQEDHKGVLWAVIRAGWPDQDPGWPASLERGAVLRVTDAEVNVWLPLALRTALIHWRYCSPGPHRRGGAGDSETHG